MTAMAATPVRKREKPNLFPGFFWTGWCRWLLPVGSGWTGVVGVGAGVDWPVTEDIGEEEEKKTGRSGKKEF